MTSPVAVAASYEHNERAALLQTLQEVGPAPDAEFDDLVALATTICGKPMGAVTLLDETTQLTKARVGLGGPQTIPVNQSMCQFTVQGTDLLMVDDLDRHEDFEASRAWREASGVRFYAGMPLMTDSGAAVGALCVMDTEPATLTPEQQRALKILARQVSNLIQARKHARDQERLVQERDRTQKLMNVILDHLPVGIYLKDSEGRLRFYNKNIADRFHITREEWIGKCSVDLWSRDVADRIMEEDREAFASEMTHITFVTLAEPDGSSSNWKSYKVRCLNADGEAMLACCSVDLTEQIQRETELQRTRDELEEANRKLSSLALTDALTGLWNRRAFNAQLETQIMASHRNGQPMSLMLVDVDHFKSVNDRFGHPYGDAVLKDIAALLNRAKRGDDLACRFGGEEFAILLPGTGIKAARHLADRILKAMRAHAWEKSPVTVSIGVAMCKPECVSDEMIDEADAALYRAKRGGRDRVVLHSDPE